MNILLKGSPFTSSATKFATKSFFQRSVFTFSKRYTKNHEWVEYSGEANTYKIGITDHAQQELGEIVYVELNTLNKTVKKSHSVGVIESVKTTADIYSP